MPHFDFDEPYADPAHWSDDEEDGEADVHYAVEDMQPYDDWKEYWKDFTAFVSDGWSRKWETDNTLGAAEFEYIACLSDVLGSDCLEDLDSCSNFILTGTTAYMASNRKRDPKGGGKGNHPICPSNFTMEDRRKKLAESNAKTECKGCGRKGHWKGGK